MCNSIAKGGQRCSSHTRPGFLAALGEWDNNGNGDISAKATEKVTMFASTKVGAEEILTEIGKHAGAEDSPIAALKRNWLANSLNKGQARAAATREIVEKIKAEKEATKLSGEIRKPRISLSPSRVNDFKSCPLAYRYKTIDKFPEPKTSAPVRGTLVHSVLEKMFDKNPEGRTLENALEMLPGEWEAMVAQHPEFSELLDESGDTEWLEGAEHLLKNYFHMEDPARVPLGEREQPVEYRLSDDVVLRGFVDRLDIHPLTQDVRIVDYKTGKSPKLGFEDKAMFQLKFYALAVWKTRGRVPAALQLMYLGDGQILRYSPTESDLIETEKQIGEIWTKIEACLDSGVFRPRKSKLCGWCAFKDKCPEFGGVIPPMPIKVTA